MVLGGWWSHPCPQLSAWALRSILWPSLIRDLWFGIPTARFCWIFGNCVTILRKITKNTWKIMVLRGWRSHPYSKWSARALRPIILSYLIRDLYTATPTARYRWIFGNCVTILSKNHQKSHLKPKKRKSRITDRSFLHKEAMPDARANFQLDRPGPLKKSLNGFAYIWWE